MRPFVSDLFPVNFCLLYEIVILQPPNTQMDREDQEGDEAFFDETNPDQQGKRELRCVFET